MRYLCLFHPDPGRTAAGSPAPIPSGPEEHILAAGALEAESALVRLRAGRVQISLEPVDARAHPPLGFVLLEARDLNEAIQLAARIPAARHMKLDVRPVLDPS